MYHGCVLCFQNDDLSIKFSQQLSLLQIDLYSTLLISAYVFSIPPSSPFLANSWFYFQYCIGNVPRLKEGIISHSFFFAMPNHGVECINFTWLVCITAMIGQHVHGLKYFQIQSEKDASLGMRQPDFRQDPASVSEFKKIINQPTIFVSAPSLLPFLRTIEYGKPKIFCSIMHHD